MKEVDPVVRQSGILSYMHRKLGIVKILRYTSDIYTTSATNSRRK